MSLPSWWRAWRKPLKLSSPSVDLVRPREEKWTLAEGFIGEVIGFLRAGGKRKPTADLLRIPPPWPGVVPKEQGRPQLAQDSQIQAVYGFQAGWDWNGYGFMGYALLSDLAQIPEYRRPSEILANEMTRKWVKLVSVSGEDKTEKLKELKADLKKFQVQETFRRAFEIDNFFGHAQIYIDVGTSGPELKNPLLLDAKIGKASLRGIRTIEPIWVYPNNYNAVNPLSPHFYRPETWFVLGTEVHQSRLLNFVSRPVPDMLKPAYLFGGVALTQLMRPYVDNWLRTRQSVSDITHNFSTPVLKTDMAQMLTPGGAQALALRAQVFNTGRDNQGLMILSKEKEDFANVSAPLSTLDKLQAQAQEQMAAIAGEPLVKLFGITPSGLNASSDGEIRVFYDTVESVQERVGTPNLKRILDILQMNRYGAIDPDIGFLWQPLWSLDEAKLADVRKANAETDAIYVESGILAPDEVRATIAAEEGSRYASIDVNKAPDLRREEEEGLEPKSGAAKLAVAEIGEPGESEREAA